MIFTAFMRHVYDGEAVEERHNGDITELLVKEDLFDA